MLSRSENPLDHVDVVVELCLALLLVGLKLLLPFLFLSLYPILVFFRYEYLHLDVLLGPRRFLSIPLAPLLPVGIWSKYNKAVVLNNFNVGLLSLLLHTRFLPRLELLLLWGSLGLHKVGKTY